MLSGLLIGFIHTETMVRVSLLKLIRLLSSLLVIFSIFPINIKVNISLAK